MDKTNLLIVIGSVLLGKVLFIFIVQFIATFHNDPDLNPKKRTGKSKRERVKRNLDDMFCKSVLDEYGKERFKSIRRRVKREE